MKKKILIVGGTGFIGYHLAKKSLKKGWRVTSISSNLPKKVRYLSKVKYIVCDVTSKNTLKKKLKGTFDYIVNLAGYVDHSQKKKTYRSHYLGCKNLTAIFTKKKPEAFVQIGSCIEYGNLKSPQKENYKFKPSLIKSIYGKAKLLSSMHLLDLFKKKKFPVTILRLYLAYGPKQDANRFLPIIINGCINNKKFPCSKGNQLRDFIHVNDVVRAIIKSLPNKNAKGKIINIGSGKPKKIINIIKQIKKITKGGHPEYGKIKFRKDEILELYPAINNAKKILNWEPKTSFNLGLAKTIKYYKTIKENEFQFN